MYDKRVLLMERLQYKVLSSEVSAQVKEIERIFKEIDSRKKMARRSKAFLESLGYQLHNLYCAFEDLFKVIAGFFENQILDTSRYHKELLRRMIISVEGVRPAVISESLFKDLDELRAFRHFFRHAYLHELRFEKLKPVLESAEKVRSIYRSELERFLKKLEGTLE